ncbi:MAG: Clp protease ClpP [Rikenellaceae bacterium]
MQNIKIKNSLDCCVIDIEGTIGVAEEWQFEHADQRVATYEKFRECVSQIETLEAKQIVVNIRSTGGDVNDAMLIYEALCSLDIPITTRCYGYVASAATVIAQAASEGARQLSANALYLVHNSTCAAEGNATDLNSMAELLLKTDECLADLYARRSGRTAEEFRTLMSEESGNGRWLTAQEAIEAALADTIIDTATVESREKEEEETSEEEPVGSVKNLFRSLGRALGLHHEEQASLLEMPLNNHNILHNESITSQEEVAIRAFEQKQAAVKPIKLKEVEDPSLAEVNLGKNQRAYQTDVQAFKH